MKIGIITFHYAPNQGAVLQAYALQTLLESWGHHVEFIDYRPRHSYNYKDFISKNPRLVIDKWQNQFWGYIYRHLRRDFNKVLNIHNKRYYNINELRKAPPIFDLYIAGSDQIWNFLERIDYPYTLDFVPHYKPKIAYAASMGQCNIPENLHKEFQKLLSSFKAISVREKNGKDFIEYLMNGSGINIAQTIDPTLLIKKEYYENIAENVIIKEPYIASYILCKQEQEHTKILRYIKDKTSLKILNLRNPDTCVRLSFAKNKIVTPYHFLSYIKNASIVVCSSFHAVVFSLIYHKPFIVLIPSRLKKTGGNPRINSLLTPLGLSHHCIYNYDSNNIDSIINTPIDWFEIDNKIEFFAKKSIDFLKESIS